MARQDQNEDVRRVLKQDAIIDVEQAQPTVWREKLEQTDEVLLKKVREEVAGEEARRATPSLFWLNQKQMKQKFQGVMLIYNRTVDNLSIATALSEDSMQSTMQGRGFVFVHCPRKTKNTLVLVAITGCPTLSLYLVLPQYLPPLCNSVEIAGSGDHILRPQQGAKVDAEVRKCLREKKPLD